MTHNVYCFDWLRRAVMLTCSTSDASFLIYCRYHEGILILRIFSDQSNGSGRTIS